MKRRMEIAETLFRSVYELQSGGRKRNPALSRVLHYGPGFQCRKRAHI
jgi:hypothetical protein